jgi:hypothetical protein
MSWSVLKCGQFVSLITSVSDVGFSLHSYAAAADYPKDFIACSVYENFRFYIFSYWNGERMIIRRYKTSTSQAFSRILKSKRLVFIYVKAISLVNMLSVWWYQTAACQPVNVLKQMLYSESIWNQNEIK